MPYARIKNKTPLEDGEIEPYRVPGRPPKNPKHKVRYPIRCLVTNQILMMLTEQSKAKDLSPSDYMRLALYRYFVQEGLVTPEVEKDASWDTLKIGGFV